jgi:glycine/D-amino acid oxidase-like deaminating enzyme
MNKKGYEIIIIGGGVIGSSIAYHLLRDGLDANVAVLEKDPTYEFATTPRSAGGFRQQFIQEVNIRMSLYGIQQIERFDEEMQVDGEPANAEFRKRGYLFLGTDDNWDSLQRETQIQRSFGAEVGLLEPEEVKKLIPDLSLEGLRGAALGRQAGYTDPYGILQGYRRKAKSLGGVYVHAEVVNIVRQKDRVVGIQTAKGETIEGKVVVVAAGAWTGEVGSRAGINLPVDPIPRMAFCFDPATKFNYDLPLVVAPGGMYFRHESGRQIFVSRAGQDDLPGFRFDWNRQFFEKEIWPDLASWIPCFERLKINRGWTGLIDLCRHDRNALLGAYPGVGGLYVAAGFSGHGLQHAPAAGRGIAELIQKGRYETIDLSLLGVERIFTGRKVLEEGSLVSNSAV